MSSYKIGWLTRENATSEELDEFADYFGSANLMLVIDGNMRRIYSDGGEPEDQIFTRDWSWIESELIKAYKAGYRDCKEEGEG